MNEAIREFLLCHFCMNFLCWNRFLGQYESLPSHPFSILHVFIYRGFFLFLFLLHARLLTKSCSFLHSRHCSSFLDAVIGYTTLLRNSMPELNFWPCNIFKLYSSSVWTRRSYLLAPSLFGVTKPIVIYYIYYLRLLAQSKWRYYF